MLTSHAWCSGSKEVEEKVSCLGCSQQTYSSYILRAIILHYAVLWLAKLIVFAFYISISEQLLNGSVTIQ